MNDRIKVNPQTTNPEQKRRGKNSESSASVLSFAPPDSGIPAFTDNRPGTVVQRKLQEILNNSPQVQEATQLQSMIDNSPRQVAQRKRLESIFGTSTASIQRKTGEDEEQTIQAQKNTTGLPENLKAGIENLSGMATDNGLPPTDNTAPDDRKGIDIVNNISTRMKNGEIQVWKGTWTRLGNEKNQANREAIQKHWETLPEEKKNIETTATSMEIVENSVLAVMGEVKKIKETDGVTIDNNQYKGAVYEGNIPFNETVENVTRIIGGEFYYDPKGSDRGNVERGLKASKYWSKETNKPMIPQDVKDDVWKKDISKPDESGKFIVKLEPVDTKYVDLNNYPPEDLTSVHVPADIQKVTAIFNYKIYKSPEGVNFYQINEGPITSGGRADIVKILESYGWKTWK